VAGIGPMGGDLEARAGLVGPVGTVIAPLSWPGLARPPTTYGAGCGNVVGGPPAPTMPLIPLCQRLLAFADP
jgi:hypothetical protein